MCYVRSFEVNFFHGRNIITQVKKQRHSHLHALLVNQKLMALYGNGYRVRWKKNRTIHFFSRYHSDSDLRHDALWEWKTTTNML